MTEEVRVLLVCTGNSCRSAMAEGLLKRMLREGKVDNVSVRSAGTMTGGGSPASEGAQAVCREVDVDLSEHRSSPLTGSLLSWADIILCMEHHHAARVSELAPSASAKTHLLAEFGPPEESLEITDPVGMPTSYYRVCRDQLFGCLRGLYEHLPKLRNRQETIAVGCDEKSVELKNMVCKHLQEKGKEIEDCGPFGMEGGDDPSAAIDVGRKVAARLASFGILIGASGVGMSIAANKIPGIRAALCADPDYAEQSRAFHDVNVLCLGSNFLEPDDAALIIDSWLGTQYSGGEESVALQVFDQLDGVFSDR
ncbi:MAG: RpiB/LacA/LacB family sugar-phosphate isomerase [Candidatus Omnitrophica bacterium]|nr:RpiB/LacA/LacB family sugar-phosphate isomerase [Candidatus Omnitrophota bacterium]MCB9769686.1 RpiB/LacA/LacB family sugar-phosphate isomerase [Candidatus Omnitrophota bacterium]MCB9782089.1 RpiB/LacA/LacB family sugar-phosphate isomerase [Candidatus Omnitrophota bacterium]